MSLTDLLNRRRPVRHYGETPVDADTVRRCLRTTQFAPSSLNIQLYEFYHVTDPAVLKRLAAACLSQRATETAQQAVVFVTRQDLHRHHAQAVSEFERGNTKYNSSPGKYAKRIKASEMYYGRILPLLYSRCLGLFGAFRVALAWCIGLFRPVMRDLPENDMRNVVHRSCGLAAVLGVSASDCRLKRYTGGFEQRRPSETLHSWGFGTIIV